MNIDIETAEMKRLGSLDYYHAWIGRLSRQIGKDAIAKLTTAAGEEAFAAGFITARSLFEYTYKDVEDLREEERAKALAKVKAQRAKDKRDG